MGNPARRFSKSRRDKRRAQTFKLSLPGIVECPQCHEMKLAHRVCKNCGYYDGEVVIKKVKNKILGGKSSDFLFFYKN